MAALLTTVVAVLLLLLQQQTLGAAGGDPAGATDDQLQYRRRHRGFRHRNPSQTPTTPPVQPVHPPPPPPPPPRMFCNDTYGADVSVTANGGDICVPMPAPPPVPRPPRGVLPRCPPCTCPRPQPRRPFPGWPVPLPGRGSSSSNAGVSGTVTECVTPLAPLMACSNFVTAANETETEKPTPTPNSDCCTGLAAFLRASSVPGGGGDQMLHCLCPFILGDVNKMLPKPIDPVRMMELPIACGVVLPPQVLYVCFTGRPSPPVVTNFPQKNSESGQSP